MPECVGALPDSKLAVMTYRLRYCAPQGVRSVEVTGSESFVTQDFSLFVHDDGELLSFELTPSVPLVMESFEVLLEHEFQPDETVLLNGYQSWTTTAELPAMAHMRGLSGVPRLIVERYAIDGIGDYRFTNYEARAGCQHGFTYGVFSHEQKHLLVASLDESRGFTLIRTDAVAGTVSLHTECPGGELLAGVPVTLGAYVRILGVGDEAYDRWFELAGIQARPVRPLVGYSSWYRHYGDIDQVKLEADLVGAQEALAGVDTERATLLFQVDDGFAKVGDWLDVKADAFPQGLGVLAARIREAGFLPGLWLAPFVCEESSRLRAEHPDWLLRDSHGNTVRTGSHWSGGLALDTLNPDVRAYVRTVLQTVTRDWGFGLLKLDFLYAACLEMHGGMNRGELMADAMALLRDAVGEDVLLLGCGVPLASAFGVVDYCRIGCDVGLDWDDKLPMRLLHRERVSTKNSMGNTITRAPLDGRVFGNDPDVFFLRDDVKISKRRRRQLLQADAESGSMLLTSDNMGEWGSSQRELFQEAVQTLLSRKVR